MTTPQGGPAGVASRIAYSDHLVGLVARAAATVARLAQADPERRAQVAAHARVEAARLSVRLDASPLAEETADAVDRGELTGHGAPAAQAGHGAPAAQAGDAPAGWARALKLEGMATQDVAALEYANVLACHDTLPSLATAVFEEPLEVLRTLHRLLCRGLMDADVAGRPRQTEQAVHDGAQGRVLYHVPPPDAVPGLLDAFAAWLGTRSAPLPALVVAGVVHERLLEWQPFEAANGRLARACARLVLQARGLDPHGLAVTERHFAADPLAYHGEVAATIRRRGDLGCWLERWGEALVAALDAAAAEVCPVPFVAVPPRAQRFAADLDGTVTLADYAREHGLSREGARADLEALERAGLLELEPASRGLRWRRR